MKNLSKIMGLLVILVITSCNNDNHNHDPDRDKWIAKLVGNNYQIKASFGKPEAGKVIAIEKESNATDRSDKVGEILISVLEDPTTSKSDGIKWIRDKNETTKIEKLEEGIIKLTYTFIEDVKANHDNNQCKHLFVMYVYKSDKPETDSVDNNDNPWKNFFYYTTHKDRSTPSCSEKSPDGAKSHSLSHGSGTRN